MIKNKLNIAIIILASVGCQNHERIIENDFEKVTLKKDKSENPIVGVWRQDSTARFEEKNIMKRFADSTFEGFSFRSDSSIYIITKHPTNITDERLGTYKIKNDSILVLNDNGVSIFSFKYDLIKENNLLLEVNLRSEPNYMWFSKYEFRMGKYEKK